MFFTLPDIPVSTLYLGIDKAQLRQLQSIINPSVDVD
jgi:hypothetical protein